MMRLLFYLVASAVAVQLLILVSGIFLGEKAANITACSAIYALIIFDLRVVPQAWSMFRRILPNVSLIDCAICAIPFGGLIAITLFEGQGVWWLAALFGYFVFGVYFLFRLPHLRRGSRDDLSWLFSPTMGLRERLRRYLGRAADVAPSGQHGD